MWDREKKKEAESLTKTVTKSPTAIDCAASQAGKGHFALQFSSAQQPQTRTQTKKRWGPALGQPSWGLGNGWSPSQGRNSASRSQKFADIKRNKAISPNTDKEKAKHRTKPHAEKKQQKCYSAQQTKPSESIKPACGVLTENADRLRAAMPSVNRRQAAEGHLTVGIRRTSTFHLIFGFCVFMSV